MDASPVAPAQETEVEFVLALGGFALRFPGALLVTHEKIPVPRFNFAVVTGVSPERQASFFEHALDHYFQRALRPSFRIPEPVEPHLDRGLRRLGFEARTELLSFLAESPAAVRPDPGNLTIRPAQAPDLDALSAFWTGTKERPEFRTAVDIAWHHPNPGEQLVPVVAKGDSGLTSAALLYRHGRHAGIYLVSTVEPARGRGAASELVRFALRERPVGSAVTFTMAADSERLERRLVSLGFVRLGAYRVYELPASAQLAFPSPGPQGPPRWRPPR